MRRFAIVRAITVFAVCGLALRAAGTLAWNEEEEKQARAQFKPGDHVEADYGFKWLPATVEEISHFGIRVKLDDSKEKGSIQRSFRQVRKPAGAVGPQDGKGEDPFATPGERAARQAMRTWTDKGGQHKTEGSLVRFENDRVTLKRKDGQEVTLPFDKLSDEDQKYLTGEGPAAAGKEHDKGAAAEGEKPESVTLIDVQADAAAPVDIGASSKWTYEPGRARVSDVQAGIEPPEGRCALGKKDFFDNATRLVLVPAQAKAKIVFLQSFKDQTAHVVTCDLKTRKVESVEPFVAGQVPLDMTPDLMRTVATDIKVENGKPAALYLYEGAGKQDKPRVAWAPYAGKGSREVAWARFLDNDHLLTANHDGHLVLWDVSKTVEPVYQAAGTSRTPALSANGKYVATAVRDGVVILEAITGRKVGHLPFEGAQHGLPAFDPEGRQLALLNFDRLRVWDLEKRELTREFYSAVSFQNRLDWVDGERVLVDGKTLFDVPHRVAIWKYSGLTQAYSVYGGRLWFVGSGPRSDGLVFGSARVPQDAALELLKNLKPEDLLLVHPGLTVSIDLQMGAYPQPRDAVYQGLKRQLEANGMTVGDGGTAKLLVSVKAGATRTLAFKRWGSIGTFPLQVVEQVLEVDYQVNGRSAWGFKNVVLPTRLQLQKGETIDQAINRQMEEHVSALGNLRPPKYAAKLPNGKTCGSSEIPGG